MPQPIVPLAQPIPQERRKLWHGQVQKVKPLRQTASQPPKAAPGATRLSTRTKKETPPIKQPVSSKELGQQKQKVQQLRQSMQEAEKYTQTLKARLQEKQTQLDSLIQTNQELKKLVQELRAQKRAAQALAQNLRKTVDNLQKEPQVSLSTEELQKLKRRIKEKETQTEQLKHKIGQLQTKLQEETTLSQTIKKLQGEIGQLSQDKKQLQEALQEEEKQLSHLQKRLAQLKNEDRQHEERIAKLEKVIADSLQKPQPPPLPAGKIRKVTPRQNLVLDKKHSKQPRLTQLPNAINGFVYDASGNPISGAIVMIKDLADNNLRALRTQEVGQFLVSTPLPNGTYRIVTEKNGLDFDILEITLEGTPIGPLEIRANSKPS